MSEIARLLTIRAEFARMRHTLARAGYDVSGVRYITDLPAVLCTVVPEGVDMDEIEASFGAELLGQLYDTLSATAEHGAMVRVFDACRPTDIVREGDLDA